MNQEYVNRNETSLYAIVDFTKYFIAGNIDIQSNMYNQIQCEGLEFFETGHCLILGLENKIEVGYIRSYGRQRVDNPDKSFEMVFF